MKDKKLSGMDGMAPVWEWPIAVWRFLCRIVVSLFFTTHPTGEELEQEIFDAHEGGCGIAVVLHGFKARRKFFHRKLELIRGSLNKRYRRVYAPILHYEHVGDIHEANRRVFNYIERFCNIFLCEPVLLIGISAGGRLAMRIEHDLRWKLNPVHVVTLASPLRGTSVIRVSPRLAQHVCGQECYEEFEPESHRQRTMSDMFENAPAHHTFHHFYSSADWIVFPPYRCIGPGTHQSLGPHPHALVQTHPNVLQYIAEFEMEPAVLPTFN